MAAPIEQREERAHGPRRLLWAVACVVWMLGALLARRAGIWVGIGSAAIVVGGLVLILDRADTLRRLRPTWKHVALGCAAGLVMVAATRVLFPLVLSQAPAVELLTAALYLAFGKVTLLKLAVMVLVIGCEEIVWRGAIQTSVERYVRPERAFVVAALAYAAAHVPVGSPLLAVVALCCGLFWGALAAWSRSLVPSLISHLIWDLAVLVFWPLLRT